MTSSPSLLAAKHLSRTLRIPLPHSSLLKPRPALPLHSSLHASDQPPIKCVFVCTGLAARARSALGRAGVEGGGGAASVGSGPGLHRIFSSMTQHETPFLSLGRMFSSSTNRSAQHDTFSPDDFPPPAAKIVRIHGSRGSDFKNQVQLDLMKKMELEALKFASSSDAPAAKAPRKQQVEPRAKTVLSFDDLRQVFSAPPASNHARSTLL